MRIVIGSRWKERDARVNRVVQVVDCDDIWVQIKTLGGRRATRVHVNNFTKRFDPKAHQEVS